MLDVLSRNAKVDFRALFKAMAKAVVDAGGGLMTGNWAPLVKDAVDAGAAIGIEAKSAEHYAARLIAVALQRGVINLVGDHAHLLGHKPTPEAAFDPELLVIGLELDRALFDRPESLPFVGALHKPLAGWLALHGLSPTVARTIAVRLGRYFAAALADEWRKNGDAYPGVAEALDDISTPTTERHRDWARYRMWLARLPEEPLFADSFALTQVYQRLRAWYSEPSPDRDDDEADLLDGPRQARPRAQSKPPRKVVVDAMGAISEWLQRSDRKDSLRVISGGPGAGKSSLAKMIAASRAEAGDRVLLIELHTFNLADDLETAINRFGVSRGLRHDVLDHLDAAPLLLIFDGLDELSIRGSAGKDAVLQLVEGVRDLLRDRNHAALKVRSVLLGRGVVVQGLGQRFKGRGQHLRLLPYFVPEDERDEYRDPQAWLAVDQRNGWWQAYGRCKALPYEARPGVLDRGRVNELTAEPLLNYLIALALDRGEVDFADPETTLTDVYDDLVRQVFDRVHACDDAIDGGAARLKPLEAVSHDDYHDFLRAIAMVAWHGEGRSARMTAIEARVGDALLERMDLLRHGSKAAISRLIAAFYFREHVDTQVGDPTYEFTHQSFAEYLVAGEIITFLEELREETRTHERRGRRGWSPDQRLIEWARIFGPAAIEPNVFEFVHDGLRRLTREHPEQVGQYQAIIGGLIGRVLVDDFPSDAIPRGVYFGEALRFSRNAGAALLVIASACGRITEALTPVEHPDPGAFGSWLRRLQQQRIGYRVPMVHRHLDWLPLRDLSLVAMDLFGADLRRAHLQGADLRRADLQGADLQGADLQGAHLRRADLQGADLQGVDLQGADLQGADLRRADLRRADLQGADLQGADLFGADLRRADLQGADLQGAHLFGAHLFGAHLRRADLRRADLQGADLQGADLRRADLQGADLQGADLRRADLRRADLQGADLQGADLQGAHLQGSFYDAETRLPPGLNPDAAGMK